tara:strand:+ start:4836 stop:5564 length:729 start_codon:yes stop_codon:yes gene_type:complete
MTTLTEQQKLVSALIKAQKEFPTMGKTKQVGVGSYGYSYLPLEQMLSLVTPVLLQNDLSLSQGFSYTPTGETLLVTKLLHKDGGMIESQLPLFLSQKDMDHPKKNQTHTWGGSVTYQRRYSIKLILGLETDMDFNMEEEEKVEEKKENRIKRTPDKPNDKGEPVESIEDKNYGKPIAQPALEAVVGKMMNLAEKYPTLKDGVINKFKKQYGITTKTIGPADIRTAEQGQYLTLLINEIDSTL